MFNITPYDALHQVITMDGDTTKMNWRPCRVVGIDASSTEIAYIIECRSANGDYSLRREEYLRRPAP